MRWDGELLNLKSHESFTEFIGDIFPLIIIAKSTFRK
jgi:hypothetical protein